MVRPLGDSVPAGRGTDAPGTWLTGLWSASQAQASCRGSRALSPVAGPPSGERTARALSGAGEVSPWGWRAVPASGTRHRWLCEPVGRGTRQARVLCSEEAGQRGAGGGVRGVTCSGLGHGSEGGGCASVQRDRVEGRGGEHRARRAGLQGPLTGKRSPAPAQPARPVRLSLSVASPHPPPSRHTLQWPWPRPRPLSLSWCPGTLAAAGRADTPALHGTAAQAGRVPLSVLWREGPAS